MTFSRPEDRFIIALCGADPSMTEAARSVRDWRSVIDTARAHRVAPLVLPRALDLPLPPQARLLLARAAREAVAATVHDNTVFAGELAGICGVLAARGIECLLVKGLSLDPSLMRPTGDIDLLVRPEELTDAIECILAIPGYRYGEFVFSEGAVRFRDTDRIDGAARARIRRQARWRHEFQLRNQRGVLVELHVRLFPRRGRDGGPAVDRRAGGTETTASSLLVVERIWAQSEPSPRLGGCRVPCPEHALLIMCLHAALKRSPSNNRFRLGTLLDIDRLARTNLRWDLLVRDCGHLALSPHVLFSLQLSRSLLGTPVPHRVLAALHEACSPAQRAYIRLHLRCMGSLKSSRALYCTLCKALAPWALGGTARERLRWAFFVPIWMPSRARMAALAGLEEGSPLLVFAYLLNPIRWALRAGERLAYRTR